MQAGARGYLLKGTRRSDIVRAVTAVGEGGAVFGAGIARRLMRYFAGTRPVAETAFPQLTARELEILQLVAAHLTNPEIADRLGLRPKTVRNNVSSILTKLCVADRAQAIVAAREAGLGGPS
jgi:DNA-binding NarL/FixJ family response regulator